MRRGEVWWAQLPKAALVEYAGVLAPDKVGLLDAAIRFALGTG